MECSLAMGNWHPIDSDCHFIVKAHFNVCLVNSIGGTLPLYHKSITIYVKVLCMNAINHINRCLKKDEKESNIVSNTFLRV